MNIDTSSGREGASYGTGLVSPSGRETAA